MGACGVGVGGVILGETMGGTASVCTELWFAGGESVGGAAGVWVGAEGKT